MFRACHAHHQGVN